LALDLGQKQDGGAPAYLLNAITLRFNDAAIERRFNISHLVHELPILRASLVGATITYASFGFLDHSIIPEAQTVAAWIRYAIVCPVLFGIVLLSYTEIFRRTAQYVLAAAMLVSGLGIVAMTAMAGDPGKSVYYAGLILVIIIGSSLVPIRWVTVSVVSSVVFAAYQIVALRINPISPQMLLNNDFFLSASVVAGIGASYLQELKARRIFLRDEGLRIASKQSDELRVKAEAASKAKSEFLAVMSHELRTPLNAILGFTEIMKLRLFGAIGSDRYVSYVDDIHQSARHLLNIVTDILDLSKAEVGKLSLEEGSTDTFAILDECLRLLREWAGEQGVRLSLDLGGVDAPLIYGDARLIKQVFLNVLSNAIKFTPSGGSVGVAPVRGPDGCLAIEFRDTGIGIAESDIVAVLEPFVQVESAFARKHGGTGLGLPLVKKIMELHGGTVSLKSKLGAGTTVTLVFPAARVTTAPAEEEPPENLKIYAR
jgi:signal transduction histidine kinase